MTSWVITIAKKHFPAHWIFAQRDSFWDMPQHHPLQPGDYAYFRVSQGPLLGQMKVVEGARSLLPSDACPWNDGRKPYKERFTFRPVSLKVDGPATWADVASRLEVAPGRLQSVHRFDSFVDEAALKSFFLSPFEAFLENALLAEEEDLTEAINLDALREDQRETRERLVVRRQGRERFRRDLLRAYGRCAVTGTAVEAVIEGAHIMRYMGPLTNKLPNGLPLRRDIHRLFDTHLLTIDAGGYVRVAPTVDAPEYRNFDGQRLLEPTHKRDQPAVEVLAAHRAKCTWLSA